MLKRDFLQGYRQAFQKVALSPPTQVDTFVDVVERGKDVPPNTTALPPTGPSPGEAPPPDSSLGMDAAKAAAQFTLNETPWGMECQLVPPKMPARPGGVFSSAPPPPPARAMPKPPPSPLAAMLR